MHKGFTGILVPTSLKFNRRVYLGNSIVSIFQAHLPHMKRRICDFYYILLFVSKCAFIHHNQKNDEICLLNEHSTSWCVFKVYN